MGKHTFQSSAYLPSPYLPSNALANRHTANALITWGNKVEINVRTPRRGDAPPPTLVRSSGLQPEPRICCDQQTGHLLVPTATLLLVEKARVDGTPRLC